MEPDENDNAELRCPSCQTPLCAPIHLCSDGHSVCAACRRDRATCPVCMATFAGVRSIVLEQLAARTTLLCRNAERGCRTRLKPAAMCQHERNCMYQMADCFMGRVWDDCTWSGRSLDFLAHCHEQHGRRMFDTDEMEFTWLCAPMEQPAKRLAAYYVGNVFGHMFNLYQVLDPLRRRILWTMICATDDPKIAKQFAYSVELYVRGDERCVLMQQNGCHGCFDEVEDELLSRCAIFSEADVKRFVDACNTLHYRVRIIRIGTLPPANEVAPVPAAPAQSQHCEPVSPEQCPAEDDRRCLDCRKSFKRGVRRRHHKTSHPEHDCSSKAKDFSGMEKALVDILRSSRAACDEFKQMRATIDDNHEDISPTADQEANCTNPL